MLQSFAMHPNKAAQIRNRISQSIIFGSFTLAQIILATSADISRGYCSPNPEVRRTNQLLECAAPVKLVGSDGIQSFGVDGDFIDELPEWFDPHFAHLGQQFWKRNEFAIQYVAGLGLTFFLIDPYVKRVFRHLGHFYSPDASFNGTLTDILQTDVWLREDMRGNLSTLFNSFNKVRSKHLKAAHQSSAKDSILRKPLLEDPKAWENPENLDLRVWDAFEADLRASKLNVARPTVVKIFDNQSEEIIWFNQYSMSASLFMHTGLVIMMPSKVMIPRATQKELEAFLHLWAFIGKSVGVEDKFNICLQPDLKTARAYYWRYFYEYMVPRLFEMDYEAKVMIENFFKGLNNAFSRVEYTRSLGTNNFADVVLLRILEDVLDIPAKNLRAVLTPFERLSNAIVGRLARNYRNQLPRMSNNIMAGVKKLITHVKLNLNYSNTNEIADKAFL